MKFFISRLKFQWTRRLPRGLTVVRVQGVNRLNGPRNPGTVFQLRFLFIIKLSFLKVNPFQPLLELAVNSLFRWTKFRGMNRPIRLTRVLFVLKLVVSLFVLLGNLKSRLINRFLEPRTEISGSIEAPGWRLPAGRRLRPGIGGVTVFRFELYRCGGKFHG